MRSEFFGKPNFEEKNSLTEDIALFSEICLEISFLADLKMDSSIFYWT